MKSSLSHLPDHKHCRLLAQAQYQVRFDLTLVDNLIILLTTQ
jgi:hypothetical protein